MSLSGRDAVEHGDERTHDPLEAVEAVLPVLQVGIQVRVHALPLRATNRFRAAYPVIAPADPRLTQTDGARDHGAGLMHRFA